MTNVQLLLSIGIPSLLIVLSWLSNNQRLNGLENRLVGVETRLDGRITGVEARLGRLEDSHHRDMMQILSAITSLHERVAVVEAKQAQ